MYIKPRSSENMKTQNRPIRIPMGYSKTLSENCDADVIAFLSRFEWNKISYPITILRNYISDTTNPDSTSVTTVGHILKFNPEDNTFLVIVHNNVRDAINRLGDKAVEVVVNTYPNGDFKQITRINIVPCDEYEDDNDDVVDEEYDK